MTKADDAMVRTALFEAANVVLTRVVRWSAKETTVPAALRERGSGGRRSRPAATSGLSVGLVLTVISP